MVESNWLNIYHKDKLAFVAAMITPAYMQLYPQMSRTDIARNAVAQSVEIFAEIDKAEE